MRIRNPVDTNGFDFLEFTTPDPEALCTQFESMGFQAIATHHTCPVTIYQQHDIRFIINSTSDSQASHYASHHGASVSAMGFKVKDANTALQYVTLKGATPYQPLTEKIVYDMPAIYGVGNTLIYFVDYKNGIPNYANQFPDLSSTHTNASNAGLAYLDHVSHHLYRGNMIKWADFYTRLFNFYEVQSSNVKGTLPESSMILTSPCKKIRIPLQESFDDNAQEKNFLNNFNGEGIQHIALGMNNIFDNKSFIQLSSKNTSETVFFNITQQKIDEVFTKDFIKANPVEAVT